MMRFLLCSLCVLLYAQPAMSEGFSVQDVDGKLHTLADYKGKWVLVNYWATWCPPCLDEIPDLIMLHDKHKGKDLEVIGIAVEYKSKKEVTDFVDSMLMSYPVVLGTSKVLKQFGAADALPISFLYNTQGKLVSRHLGAVTQQQIEKHISGK